MELIKEKWNKIFKTFVSQWCVNRNAAKGVITP